MYKHIFFDLDHTIWDFETNAAAALQELYQLLGLQEKGVNSEEEFLTRYLYHNTMVWDKYHKGIITAADLKWKRMHLTLVDFKIGDMNLAKEMSTKFLEILPEKKGLFPYTFEILNYLLQKNYTLHLITNGFELTQWRKLKSSGLDKYFTQVITSEATGFIKPNPEIFDYALKTAEAGLAESIMIGDNIDADIIGAHNAGWKTIFTNHINTTVPKEATYSIRHLKELELIF